MKSVTPTSFAGIDYGSKLAGTTVIAHLDDNQVVRFHQSVKKQDADAFLLEFVARSECTHLFIDAPLSLPVAYSQPELGDDFFYRQADRELSAMSPMFLGGLTARAMRIARLWRQAGLKVYEIYPARVAHLLQWQSKGYKKEQARLPSLFQELQQQLPYTFSHLPQNWHQLDAALALYSGYRFINQQHLEFGLKDEGVIIV